jgi:acyl-coenzyme A synthetase/AMP-(fatty) acid ligase
VLALMRQGSSFILAPHTAAADIKPVPLFCRWKISVGEGALPPDPAFITVTLNPAWSGGTMPSGRFMLRTSGSMGVSKIVVHSHAGMVGNALNCVARYDFRADSRCSIPVPIAHMYGGGAALLPAILAGASVDVIDKPNILSLLDHEKRFRPTIAFVTPTICDMLIKGYKTPRDMFHVVVTSGQRIGDETFIAFDRAISGRLVNQYGSSEMGATAACRPDDSFDQRFRSIGQPMDGVRLEIEGGDRGELLVHHPFGYQGYLDDSGTWLRTATPGAPFVTGDVAERDGDGAIRVVGRSGSSVNRDGYLVVLEEIERLMETLPDVASVVVIATGGGTARGERLAAFCVRAEGSAADGPSIRAQCFDIMPRYALPDDVHVLDSLPLLPSGKVDRRALAAGLAQPEP